MKKVQHSQVAVENARAALDEIETAFGVKTGLKAGGGGKGNAYGHNNPRNPHSEPEIIALYGVVVADL